MAAIPKYLGMRGNLSLALDLSLLRNARGTGIRWMDDTLDAFWFGDEDG